MNTSKQVNVMIGVVFLTILLIGAYALNESNRQSEAEEEITERVAERGARLFVNNCRNCHGLEGQGHVGPPLNIPGFRILHGDNAEGVPATPDGEADSVRSFLFNTIACGRTGTFMPVWAQRFGGPLSDTQIEQLVLMITEGRWDLVEEIGAELDHETGFTEEDILADPAGLAPTQKNCGQFNSETAADIRDRDPFVAAPAPTGTPPPGTGGGTATPPPATGGPSVGTINVELNEFRVIPSASSSSAGNVTFAGRNSGQIPHELKVVRTDLAAESLPVTGGRVNERASGLSIVGRTPEFAGGRSQNVAVSMQAGRYVLICNIAGHYQGGMRAAFTVQ